MGEEQVVALSDTNFVQTLNNSDVPVLVDFWATWCQPCLLITPILKELADEYKDALKICRLDIMGNNSINQALGIQSLPTMIIFKNGKEVKRIIGAKPKESLKLEIEEFMRENSPN